MRESAHFSDDSKAREREYKEIKHLSEKLSHMEAAKGIILAERNEIKEVPSSEKLRIKNVNSTEKTKLKKMFLQKKSKLEKLLC
jgi:hypothetical protein